MGILIDRTQALEALLPPNFSVHWVDVTASTNDDVKQALKCAQGDTWIVRVAQRQTAGRGTHGRIWTSEKEALLLSLGREGLFPGPMMSVVLGWALLRLCLVRVPKTQIKWPNDLYIDGKKLSGILCERCGNAVGKEAFVVGVGINLQGDNSERAYLPIPKQHQIEFCAQVVRTFVETITHFSAAAVRGIASQWHEHDFLADKVVEVTDAKNHKIRGKVVGISSKGELVVNYDAGTVHILNGSVRMIKEKLQ